MSPFIASIIALINPWSLAVLGLCVGSFINVVIYRLPMMLERRWLVDSAEMLSGEVELTRAAAMSKGDGRRVHESILDLQEYLKKLPALTLCLPRSRCLACGHQLAWYEHIPLVGWIALRGKCSDCKSPISWRYTFIELLTAACFAGVYSVSGTSSATLLGCVLVAYLIALGGIDFDTTLLPDLMTLPLMWLGILAAMAGITIPLTSALTGAMAGYLSLWSINYGFYLLRGEDGMGHGDFKLLAAIGAWLGASMLLPLVVVAACTGVIGAILSRLTARQAPRHIPFGPYLVLGALVVYYAGQQRVLSALGWV